MEMSDLNRNHFQFFNFNDAPSMLESLYNFDVFYAKASKKFVESPRKIDSWVRDSLIFMFFLVTDSLRNAAENVNTSPRWINKSLTFSESG